MESRMLIKLDAWLTSTFGISIAYLLTKLTDIMPQVNAFLISCVSLAFFYWRYREAKARALQEEAKYEEAQKNRNNSKADKI